MKISIAQPCNASWQEMTPVERGRFCQQCAKEVIDFTGMTDAEVVAHYERHGQVCGRFLASQLDREMYIPRRRSFMPAALLAGALSLIIPEKTKAQGKISGYVMDSSGAAIPYATIHLMGTNTGTISASNGSFSFTVPAEWKDSVKMQFSMIGYRSRMMVWDHVSGQQEVCVELQQMSELERKLSELVVVGLEPPRHKFWKWFKRRLH